MWHICLPPFHPIPWTFLFPFLTLIRPSKHTSYFFYLLSERCYTSLFRFSVPHTTSRRSLPSKAHLGKIFFFFNLKLFFFFFFSRGAFSLISEVSKRLYFIAIFMDAFVNLYCVWGNWKTVIFLLPSDESQCAIICMRLCFSNSLHRN